jgi:glyoxylase-like metal-dependent hydrolase (beta-lactamase superfamily II)/rhodanese-related sulfurtransferase
MYFKQFLHDDGGCSSYLIASRESREAVVVDAQYAIEPYVQLAAERGYVIAHVIDTHLHADHSSGNRRLAAATGARLWLPESADVRFAFGALRDGGHIQLGQVVIRAISTPGHRPEAISLLVSNTRRSPEPSMVLSGDTLFVGDVGRPDFGGPEGAEQQFDSTRRLLDLPDWVEVFPAHFEGSCGKSMCGRPSSTIGFERRFNPMLQLPRAEFVRLAAEPSPRPLNMTAILAYNRGLSEQVCLTGDGTGEIPGVVPKAAAKWLLERDLCVVDVREQWEYADGHLPEAVSIPQADLAVKLDTLPHDQHMLVVCRSGARSLRAARFLKAVGFEHVFNLDGGMLGWIAARKEVVTASAA